MLVELKNPNKQGRLSEIQIRAIKHFKDVEIEVYVVDNKEEIDRVIRDITQP